MRQLQLASVLAVSALLALPVAASPSRDVSKTLPLAAGEGVLIDTYKGSVKVSVWDRAEVSVVARIEADGECGSPARQARWVDQTKVEIVKSSYGVSIKSDYGDLDEVTAWFGGCTARPFVRYTIQMPKGGRLKIKDYKSDLDVRDLEADLDVDTYKGRLHVAGLAGGLRIETYKGDVNAAITRLAGDVLAETYKGSVVLTLPASAAFELAANAGRHGSVQTDFPAVGTTTARRGSLRMSGAVNGGGARVSLRTDKGSLAVRKS